MIYFSSPDPGPLSLEELRELIHDLEEAVSDPVLSSPFGRVLLSESEALLSKARALLAERLQSEIHDFLEEGGDPNAPELAEAIEERGSLLA